MDAQTHIAPQSAVPAQRVNVLGVGVSVLNLGTARERIAEAIRAGRKGYICITGVHGVMEAQDDPEFRRILNESFLCTPDGMPMVWMGKLHGHSSMGRVYGPDLMLELFAASKENGWRHFFYGGSPGVAEQLSEKMGERFPGVEIAGCHTPPFRPLTQDERAELKRTIDLARPDIMWVGLSTPKQERFMAEAIQELSVPIMIGVGAAFDFHSGRVRQAPVWIQRSGFEWLFRLCQEPRRLWKRYLRNNPLFLLRVACQLARLKRYPLNDKSA